jgi:hyperosmotically inducible periplasmic protein
MKALIYSMSLAVLLSVAGCQSLTGQSTGEYVDDRTISTSVKAKLVADKAANLTRVDVDTTNRVVLLSGVVESSEQKNRAEQLAMQVSGVSRVENRLQVQGRN